MSTAKQIMNRAISYIGTKESPANSNNVIFNTHYYGCAVSGSDYPWCCAYVWDIFRMEGASKLFNDGVKTAYCPTVYNWAKRNGYIVNKNDAQYGDIVLFDWGGDRLADHIGFIESYSGGVFHTVEGNTAVGNDSNGGAVMRRTRYASQIQAIVRPRYDGVTSASVSGSTARSYLMRGDTGSAVKTMQAMLIACGYSCGSCGADGDFGNDTDSALRRFQSAYGLEVDGKYGVQSKAKLQAVYGGKGGSTTTSTPSTSNWISNLQSECNSQGYSNQIVDGIAGSNTLAGCPTLRRGAKGNITRIMQARLISLGYSCGSCGADGDFGNGTLSAVKRFQSAKGIASDGVVGKNTWRKLLGL